ncbi:MAG: hypothetical protein ACOC33_03490 [bacterium]
MARPKRKKLRFDEESVNKLLQEIYDDTHNIRASIKRLFTKWETKIKEGGEIAALGDQVVKLINAEAKNQDQKIMLLKYLKEVVFDKTAPKSSGGTNNKEEEDRELTKEERNELLSMVRKEVNKKGG